MPHTRIPDDELRVFQSLKNVRTVFDVGARDDVDYLILKPKIRLHAFEPNPLFFAELKANVGDTKNVWLNNFGLGDVEGTFEYNDYGQSIGAPRPDGVPIKRLDNYIKKHRIKRIDFLKIDTEGSEWRIIRGLGSKIKICRYIQYEQDRSINDIKIEDLLAEHGFTTYYTGYRNQIAVAKGELLPWIPETPQEGGVGDKDSSNYLTPKL